MQGLELKSDSPLSLVALLMSLGVGKAIKSFDLSEFVSRFE